MLMKRKLVQQGNNALTISLPFRWIEKHKLKKGDYINLLEQGLDLLVTPQENTQRKKHTLEISQDKPFFKRYIRSFYVLGYDEIEIISKQKIPFKEVEDSLKDLIGYEMLLQQPNRCLLGILSQNSNENLDLLIKKLFFMINMMFDDIIEIFDKKDLSELKEISRVEKTVNSFVDFCLRNLNKQGYENYNKTQNIYHILTILEEIADSLRDFSLNTESYNVETKQILINLKDYYDKNFKLYLNYNMCQVVQIKNQRLELFKKIRTECKKIPEESLDLYTILVLLHQLEVIIDPVKIKEIK